MNREHSHSTDSFDRMYTIDRIPNESSPLGLRFILSNVLESYPGQPFVFLGNFVPFSVLGSAMLGK